MAEGDDSGRGGVAGMIKGAAKEVGELRLRPSKRRAKRKGVRATVKFLQERVIRW